MGLQVNVDGNDLDNGSWRYIVEGVGDDISLDNTRMLVIDFVIEANDAATLSTRWQSTRDDFIKANPRATINLDDTQGELFADVSQNDGVHTVTKTTVGVVGGKGQTDYSLYCRLFIEASVTLFNQGGATGSGGTTYTGLIDKINRVTTYDAGRTEGRDLLMTFGATFDDDGGLTVATVVSVADSGGKAVFTISEVPPTFAEGMRLELTSSTSANGDGYAGVHLVTAINVGGKTITTDTAFDGDETGSGKLGQITTGEANYQASRGTILTDLLGVSSDGTRDATTGLYLAMEKKEHDDENENQVTVLLQARYAETELTGINDAQRDLDVTVSETEPHEWDTGGGTKPVYLAVTGSIACDRDELSDGSLVLHQVFRAQLLTQLKTLALTNTGYTVARLREVEFGSNEAKSRMTFRLVYQAKNTTTLLYRDETLTQTEDDRVTWKAGRFHYDQRPEGLPPKTITRTITYVGWTRKALAIPTPSAGGGATYSPGPRADGPERDFDTPDGKLYARTASQIFFRRQYEGGAQGVQVV